MANPTSNFNWQMPTPTDLVTDLPADFEVFGQAVDSSMADLLGGTTGQILAKNSNTNMDFVWIANDQGDITGITATSPLTGGGTSGAVTVGIQDALTTQKGAVQLSDSTSTTSSILAATPTAVKSAYDLADGAIAKSTLTTAGDIIYRNATVPIRLGIGTAGQVLQVNSGATAPEWATPAGGGGMTLLSTTTLSGATTTISSISQDYVQLFMTIEGVTNATADGTFRIAPNGVDTTQTITIMGNNNTVTTSADYQGKINSGIALARANAGNSFACTINNYTSTTGKKSFEFYGGYINTSSAFGTVSQTGDCIASPFAAITSLVFSNAGGNLSTGTVKLYGVK
jgi:hypothetical protein